MIQVLETHQLELLSPTPVNFDLNLNQQAISPARPEEEADDRLPARPTHNHPWRGLLWCEWFSHSKLFLGFLLFWLVSVWTLPLFTHSGWILLVAPLYALLAGAAYGGGDTIEGCEEFAFSLPATRSERYLARLAVGGGGLLLFTGLDLLALGLDVPQFLARFYLDAGLLKPLPVLKLRLLYGLVLAVPFLVFAFSFVLSAISHSRMLILTAWFWSLLGAMSVSYLALRYEEILWHELNGFVATPLLMLFGLAALWGGYQAYILKEIGQHDRPLSLPPRFWLWLVLLGLGLAVGLLLISLLARQYPHFLANTGPPVAAQQHHQFNSAQ
jgi:hypothetical protein